MTEWHERDRNNPRTHPFYSHHLAGFLAIGSITTLTDISLLYVLTEWTGIWYLTSALISYCTGVLLSYILNKKLNYRNESTNYVAQGMMFLVISGCSLILNLGIVYTGVEYLGVSYLLAKIVATGAGFFLNYIGQTNITFRRWR